MLDALKKSLGSQATILLSNLEDEDIQAIIDTQKSIVQSFIDYPIDWTAPEALLQKIAIDFAKFEIYQSEARKDVPESIKYQYENGFKLLDKIQKGLITFGIKTDEENETSLIEFSSNEQYFQGMI